MQGGKQITNNAGDEVITMIIDNGWIMAGGSRIVDRATTPAPPLAERPFGGHSHVEAHEPADDGPLALALDRRTVRLRSDAGARHRSPASVDIGTANAAARAGQRLHVAGTLLDHRFWF